MMFPYPYFRSPFYRNYPRYTYKNKKPQIPESYIYETTQKKEESPCIKGDFSNDSARSSDEQFFEIFGIKLYFDDILLICLLFFLYTEGVEDQSLFIALILLLLS